MSRPDDGRTPLAPRPDGPAATEVERLAARRRWARRRGHPGYLWPDVDPADWQTATAALTECTRRVLAGDRAVLDGDGRIGARALGIAGFTSGMGPLLGAWLSGGLVDAPGPIRRLFTDHLDHGRRRWVRAVRLARDVIGAFDHDGVTTCLLKGIHTAAFFPEPGARPLTDVDIVIRAEHRHRAEACLAGNGFVMGDRFPNPYRSDWSREPEAAVRSLDLTHADNPLNVDLHASLVRVFGGVRHVAVAAPPWPTVPLPTVGMGAAGLAQPVLTAYLAAHASDELHHLQLVRLVELVLVIRRDVGGGSLRWDALRTLLADAEAARFTYPAFHLAEQLLPGTLDEPFAEWLASRATPRMRRILGTLRPETALRLDHRSLAERLMWAATPGDWVRGAIGLVWPRASNAGPIGRVMSERLFRLLRGRVTLTSPSRQPGVHD